MQAMPKGSLISLLLLFLTPFHFGLQSAADLHPRRLALSTCSNAHGWIKVSTADVEGYLSCFSPEIHGGYASIGGGSLNGSDEISIQMDFLSRSGTHTCKVPMVSIEFLKHREKWDAYRVRNGQFGNCTITQTFENDHKLWKGSITANLVMVKGDTDVSSPRRLHSEKDSSGQPITRKLEVRWEFDQLFKPHAAKGTSREANMLVECCRTSARGSTYENTAW